jgi:hypothetical protein
MYEYGAEPDTILTNIVKELLSYKQTIASKNDSKSIFQKSYRDGIKSRRVNGIYTETRL